jgi:spermidine synthase
MADPMIPTNESRLVFSCHDDEGVVEVVDDVDARALYFGTPARQSAMSREEPHRLVLSYTRAMLSGLLFTREPRSALVLGLGGGSLPRFLMHAFPTCRLDVVERRAKVVQVAHDYFHLARSPRLRIHVCDAELFLREDPGRTYDLVLVDLHDANGNASLVSEAGFVASCARRLAPRGVLAANLWTGATYGIPPAVLRDHRATFERRHLALPVMGKGNCILLGLSFAVGSYTRRHLGNKAMELEVRLGIEFPQLLADLARANRVLRASFPS